QADPFSGTERRLFGQQRLDTLWARLSLCAGGRGAAGIGLGAGERSAAAFGGDGYDGGESGAGGDESPQRLRRRGDRGDDGGVSGEWRDGSESFASRQQVSDTGEGR